VRILTVADAFYAMSSSLAYRRGMPSDHIVQELRRCSNSQFDARIVNLFIDMLQTGEVSLTG